MRFYKHDGGDIVCRPCRAVMLANVDAALSAYAGYDIGDDDRVYPRDFEALGLRPWAGEDEGFRYVQCDRCLEQWGPDA